MRLNQNFSPLYFFSRFIFIVVRTRNKKFLLVTGFQAYETIVLSVTIYAQWLYTTDSPCTCKVKVWWCGNSVCPWSVYVCMQVHMCECAETKRHNKCLPGSLSTLVIRTESLTEPRTQRLARLTSQWGPRILLSPLVLQKHTSATSSYVGT